MGKNVGLIGGVSGKVGTVVFATRRGVQITRAYQPIVANPKSKRQLLSRAKLALATGFVKEVRYFVRAGWQKIAPTFEVQKAIGRMIPVTNGAITGDTPEGLTLVMPSVATCLSADELGYLTVGSLSSVNGKVVFSVVPDDSMFIDAAGADIRLGCAVCVRSTLTGQAVVAFSDLQKGDNTVEVEMPASWDGAEVDVFAFAKQIPEAVNGIASELYPWKFPAACSRCAYVGSVEVNFQ